MRFPAHQPNARLLPLMKIRLVRLLVPMLLAGTLQAQWRSTLYPENWQRPSETTSFYTAKLIQDFSYAGYKSGTQAIPTVSGPVYDVTSPTYGADKAGNSDSTVAIQNAINAAQTAGGGVVYLPAGTYQISPQGTNAYCLRISKSNVVLRGAGSASTFLFNTQTVMRSKSVVEVSPASTTTGSAVLLTADLTGPTRRIPVATPSTFAVGDVVMIKWDLTDAWVVEHNQQTWWNTTKGYPASAEYLREVVAVNQAQGWIEVDVPTRYTMKTRDNARVSKVTGFLTGVGVEALSIGNVQHSGTTWGESDYGVVGTAAYDAHGSWLLEMRNLRDCWASDVKSYMPSGNTTTAHMLSNGVSLNDSMRVTVRDCWMGRPQYGGGGGNGYMYRLQNSNDCLVQSCTSDLARHGFVISHAGTSGNVFLQCDDRETGRALGASSTPYATTGSGSDNHMHFSHSNLWDRCNAYNSFYTAHHRTTSGTVPHGLTSAHAVYWNTTGGGTRYTSIVKSEQGRYGYVIGTSGSKSGVTITTNGNTSPADHLEGVGSGATLEPASLYQDQLERRLRPVVTYKVNGSTGGMVPTDGNNPYTPGTAATILGAGTMSRTGYTFNGWNTMSDGSGADYAVSSTFTIDNHLTLYAKWTANTYAVTFDKQSGTGGSSGVTATYGAAMPTATAPTRSGWIFAGYYSAINGGGTQYYTASMTSATTWNLTANTTLYAYWTSSPTVNFEANGGTTPSPVSKTVTTGSTYGSLATTSRPGYTFKGWYTAATGGTAVTSITTVTEPGYHTLYAQWTTETTAASAAKHYIRGEAENPTTHPLGYYTSANDLIGVAGASGARYDHNVVFSYTLPTLPTGATLDGATVSFEITTARDSTGDANLPDLHVYLLDSADPTGTGTTFFYHGNADPNASAKLVGAATPKPTITGTADNPFSPAESRSITLSGAALDLLKSYYSGNTPTRSTVYFRFNMSVDPATTTFRRYRVNTAANGSSLQLNYLAPANSAPTWSGSTVNKAAAAEGSAYAASLTSDASDIDHDVLTFAKVSGPAWLNVAADGSLSGTPGSSDVGDNSFTVSVRDGSSMPVQATLAISVRNAFDGWLATNGSGTTFTGDANGDGITDGLAWLLGAATPGAPAHALMPTTSETGGDLVLNFRLRKSSARGAALLQLQTSWDLGQNDPWDDHTVTVPDTNGTDGGVLFVITPVDGQDYIQVQATVPASAAGGTGRVFVRLNGTLPTP